ncbi:hypothetical protein ABL78_6487 [Leptomonas seymouri]|uniref:Uncharacterized protein n=1 Tax=Leptomonas seymouri TaxID=5684 RepID=A0A0N1I3A2_LEPSE|nr:hypothetical protein ABL78_6487 [Leptomonas seymouri]|eukprot:KPI84458.1 hypothetical protein ABL78_6487 [Leptomonas seymouri]
MGGAVARERRRSTARKPAPKLQNEGVYMEAAQMKPASKMDIVKVESRVPTQPKCVEEQNPELTEEMVDALVRSSTDNINSKKRQKDMLENWLLRANYKTSAENDALERHRKSMGALRMALCDKKERVHRPKPEHVRSNSHSRKPRSRSQQSSSMEMPSSVRTAG